MALNVLSINAKGINHPVKRKSLWKDAILHNSDILCAQETHFSSLASPKCTHKNYSFIFTANADSKTKGVLITIRDTIAFKLHEEIKDPQGKFLILICKLNLIMYTIVTMYSPNKHQIHFFNKLMKTKVYW